MTGSFVHNDFLIDNYSARLHVWQDQDHLIAPVVLMVPGVHHGSGGPLLYEAEELAAFAMAWNGVPVPVGHPMTNDGEPLSANDPSVLDAWNVGRLFNVFWDEEAQKLRGEVWVNIEDAQRINPAVLTYLRTGRALEVSTGLFSEHDMTAGTYNGEEYSGRVHGVRPDHLALLPGAIGACSVADGCGIRLNIKNSEEPMEKNLDHVRNELGKGSLLARLLKTNENSFREIMYALQRTLDQLDGQNGTHYLEAVYPERLIYRVEKDGATRYYEGTYGIDDEGQVSISEDNTLVEPDFVPVQTTNKADEATTLNQEEEMKQNRQTVVATLRTNGKIAIDDAAAEALTNLDSCDEFATQIGELIASHAVASVEPVDAAIPETVEAVIDNAPEGFQADLRKGQELLANAKTAEETERADTVATITSNAANTFTAEQLEAMDTNALKSIAALCNTAQAAQPATNLGAAGVETEVHINSDDAPAVMEEPSINRFASDAKK
jgi:hypothetical protein